jgi:hypothetical protein
MRFSGTATASGGLSSSIAGTTKSNTIAMLNASPTSDMAPRSGRTAGRSP